MFPVPGLKEAAPRRGRCSMPAVVPVTAHALTEGHKNEALAFLAARPLHTVYMAGLIRDNGLVSPFNRGTFYGCRGAGGELVGVALIGHVTQVEVRARAALKAFARLAQDYSSAHVIMGEHETLKIFWGYYAGAGQALRLSHRELLLEQRWPVPVGAETRRGIRPATLEDLPLVMPAQAGMAFAECGVNPMERDPAGFYQRYRRRVEHGRVWVSVADGRLIFKADVMSETPEAIYLEGVYTDPQERRKGYGLGFLSQLAHTLLARAGALCLLVSERNQEARAFYHKAGYRLCGNYDTLYLQGAAGSER